VIEKTNLHWKVSIADKSNQSTQSAPFKQIKTNCQKISCRIRRYTHSKMTLKGIYKFIVR